VGEGIDINNFGEVLTASWRKDNPLQIWDFETKKLRKAIEWNYREREENVKMSTQLYCCKYSKDFGKLIFAGGSVVNSVKIFDWNGRGLASFDKLSHGITCLDSSNDVINKSYQLLAFAGGEGAIRIFRIKYQNPNI
jgi:COMPASS component SWD3